MGQKVNPYSFRLGVNKTWKSRWYVGPRDYVATLHEDLRIRQYILKLPEARSADISDIEIVRYPQRVQVYVHSSRPGVLIGTKGANIELIGQNLQKILSPNTKASLKIKELKHPEIDAQTIALTVAKQLQARGSFRHVLKMTIASAMKTGGAKGAKIKISGRLAGAEMSRTFEMKEGRVPLQTLRADIDYAHAEAYTTYGVIGVKVWIFKGELLSKAANVSNMIGSEEVRPFVDESMPLGSDARPARPKKSSGTRKSSKEVNDAESKES